MKNRIIALPCLAIFLASFAVAQAPTKVGVIQIQAALVGTKDGQKAVAELQVRMAPKQKEIERKRSEIQELQDKLSKGGNAMAQAAKDTLSRDIEQKTKVFNRDVEDAQAEAQGEERKVLEELSQKMQAVIEKYAVANGYAVLLDSSNQNTNLIFVATGTDITKDIIDLYDKANPVGPSTRTAAPATTPTKPAATTTRPAATTPVKKQP